MYGEGGSLSPRNHFSESVSRWVFSGFRAPTSILWDASFPRRYSERRRPSPHACSCALSHEHVSANRPQARGRSVDVARQLPDSGRLARPAVASRRLAVAELAACRRRWVAQRRQAPGGARRPSSATLRTVETLVVAAAFAGRAGRVSLRAGRTDLIGRLSTGQCLDLTGVQGALLFPEQGLPCEHWPCGPWK